MSNSNIESEHNMTRVSKVIEEVAKFYVMKNIDKYPSDKFYSEILKVVKQSLEVYKLPLLVGNNDENTFEDIFYDVMKSKSLLRECGNSYMTEINKEEITKKIKTLKAIEQPTQRTNAWYEFRHNMITASNAWKA